MTAHQLAQFLARIRNARTAVALQEIADEAQQEFPTDEATPRIVAMVAVKHARILRLN